VGRVLLRIGSIAVILVGALAWGGHPAFAQAPLAPEMGDAPRIEWEVKNRFRLFRDERDFNRHVAASRGDGILAAETRLARDSDGRGWARDMVGRLCIDGAGQLMETCTRDGVKESYLAPLEHRILTVLANAPLDATCTWRYDDGDTPPQQVTVKCEEEVTLRVRSGRPTITTVDITLPDNSIQRVSSEILVRDLLIAGLGDSIASGDGNPDRPVALAADGFCFRRFLGTARSEYFRPGRAGYRGDKACDLEVRPSRSDNDWSRAGARWVSAACHRSLYSYQLRTALQLAVENPRIAVTFVPLACTGASIADGLVGSQPARETTCGLSNGSCPRTVNGQIAQARNILNAARRAEPGRSLDLVLLTIGANDIRFSGLVADVIVSEGSTERTLLKRGGAVETVEGAEAMLTRELPGSFLKLREALKSLLGGDLSRVVYVSYGNPGLVAGGTPCPGGRDGFDVHPALAADPGRLRRAVDFVGSRFLPMLKALALCQSGVLCRDPATDRMTFVDSHQAAFAEHGFCARSPADPPFDQACFSASGDSFAPDPVTAATHPLVCDEDASEFRPYAARARWIRTANDSYFTAMTYPEGLASPLQPTDIHDATWGVTSVVYGGAIHPTAEGHAAMADAALPAAREVLGLPLPGQ
jgi:hypothetical protein